nr:amyotrophic lateral sclerosis 2 chromosomal region candidate gene 12 protein [Pogona vitticeps]XP_020667418.1 amyotrophic lateral sclerosis 2 chromosomal region candidate gene 12 protein [Pogona vitticeps]XP_020667419.1 amyotrophic lateral sclerosis 2 chromosomal region candidate gene 12 protein [Pogona vitticeps]XP_020667420.1 amyotrophic lateral sclerosis 2 chromosomal region candidate gene 12 protein [Pogona vitticeps]XP_020667421.1 amyotrophic lateral sclerosis 2 chromosomal region candi
MLRAMDMSQSQFLYCPCWDPWKIGCKRLMKSKAGQLSQKPKSPRLGVILRDQSNFPLAGTPRVRFPHKTYVQQLRSREPRDISKEFEEEVIPGFTLTRSKEHIDVTLGQEFFERKKPAEEPARPVVPSTPPKLETEDVVADLVDQISELTAMMEQLRRDNEATHRQLEKDMEMKCSEMQEEHENKMREIQAFHASELSAVEEQYKKELRNERATAQEKLAGMQKEYKYLKNAFRVYQDSISDEMEEKWLRRQAEWKKSERTEREKALLQQKQSLTKKFEQEIEEQKKIIQNNSFLVGKVYEQEREAFQKQQQTTMNTINELNQKITSLETELNEKNETLNAIASSLHNTELELRNEKANLLEMEKMIQHRIASIEEKHRINVASLVEENVILRRKLIEKNEELYNERSRRSSIFEPLN